VRYQKSGFSLLELLIILGVTAILIGLAGFAFAKERQKGELVRISQTFGQNIRLARAQALAKSNNMRIQIDNHNQYSIEEWNSTNNTWRRIKRVKLNGKGRFDSDSVNLGITFDSRGYAEFSPQNIPLIITNDSDRQELIISMTGNIVIRDNP